MKAIDLTQLTMQELEDILPGDAFDTSMTDCGDIKQVQLALQQQGYYEGPINGVWDESMVPAMQSYLSDLGLPTNNKSNTAFCSALQDAQRALRSAADAEIERRTSTPKPTSDTPPPETATSTTTQPKKSSVNLGAFVGGAVLLGVAVLFLLKDPASPPPRSNPIDEEVLRVVDEIHSLEDHNKKRKAQQLLKQFMSNAKQDPQKVEDFLFALSVPRLSSETMVAVLGATKHYEGITKSRRKFFDEVRRRLYDIYQSTAHVDALLRGVR